MKRVFILKGLDCPNCSAKIEKEVGELGGVASSTVNLMNQTLTVQAGTSVATSLLDTVTTIVHSHEPDVKHDTPFHSCRKARMMSRVWGGTAFAKRSNESPSGAFKRQRGLRQQMEGRCPDKRYPNKITWKTRKSLRSEVPVEHNIFKN